MLVTMLSIGYGDITPKTEAEIIVCMFCMIAGRGRASRGVHAQWKGRLSCPASTACPQRCSGMFFGLPVLGGVWWHLLCCAWQQALSGSISNGSCHLWACCSERPVLCCCCAGIIFFGILLGSIAEALTVRIAAPLCASVAWWPGHSVALSLLFPYSCDLVEAPSFLPAPRLMRLVVNSICGKVPGTCQEDLEPIQAHRVCFKPACTTGGCGAERQHVWAPEQDLNKESKRIARYRARMEAVDKWMSKRSLPKGLRQRIGHYYQEVCLRPLF